MESKVNQDKATESKGNESKVSKNVGIRCIKVCEMELA